MTQELRELIARKHIFVYTLVCGRTFIGEKVLSAEGELDPDRRSLTLCNVMELSYEIDDDKQSDFAFVPIAPGNTNNLTIVFVDQIASITHCSDLLKRHWFKMVTANQVVDSVMRGEVSKDTLKELKNRPSAAPRVGSASGLSKDYSIQRVDSFGEDVDETTAELTPAQRREPLDLESTAPFEVGLESFEGEDAIWKTIMSNFPHRPWKLG